MVTGAAKYCPCCFRRYGIVAILMFFMLPLGAQEAPGTATLSNERIERAKQDKAPTRDKETQESSQPDPAKASALSTGNRTKSEPEAELKGTKESSTSKKAILGDKETVQETREPPTRAPSHSTSPPNRLSNSGSLLGTPFPTAQHIPSARSTQSDRLREILVVAPNLDAAKQQKNELTNLGLRIRQRKSLDNLGLVLSLFRVPASVDLDELTTQLQADFPNYRAEINQRYHPLGKEKRRYGHEMIGLPASTQCGSGIRLAMLDTKVSEYVSKELEHIDLASEGATAHRHGSAIAQLLVGQRDNIGLLPKANLTAINVFDLDKKGKLITTTYRMLSGMDAVAGLKPRPHAINISLGGRYSALLEWAIKYLHDDSWIIAAAGNSGNKELVYPAAYKEVIAVSAIDHRQRRARKSNSGPHIDFSAPGVDIWTLDESGKGFYASGTSYAAPFITAILAMHKAAGTPLKDIISSAIDLGKPGKDELFGYGFLQLKNGC